MNNNDSLTARSNIVALRRADRDAAAARRAGYGTDRAAWCGVDAGLAKLLTESGLIARLPAEAREQWDAGCLSASEAFAIIGDELF